MDQKIIYTRNGDIWGNQQIIAVMERNIIYMRKTVLYAPRNKNIAVVEQKIYHLYEEQICREQGTNYSGRGTKYHLYDERAQGKIMAVMEQKNIIYIRNRYLGGKEQIIAVI
jgi:hypothetical protein